MSISTITNPTNADHFARLEPVDGIIVVSVGKTELYKTDKAIQLFEF